MLYQVNKQYILYLPTLINSYYRVIA